VKGNVVLTVLALCSATACLGEVEGRGDAEKRSERAEKTAAALHRSIPEEIKALGNHPWAGQYYFGDGLGVNVSLILAPQSGYLFEWHGCLGLYDRNYGAATWKKDRLRLSFTFPNERKGFQGIAEEFVPVAWGDRKYLIPVNDIVGFCNRVNDGFEPREGMHGFYLLRDGDEKKDVKGLPSVPEEFRPYLLARPIEAKIISVGQYTTHPSVCDWKFKLTPVTLNCGKNKGLLKGMELHVVEPEDVVESVEVTKVGAETAEATMTQIGEEQAGPQIGWKLSTRFRWHSD